MKIKQVVEALPSLQKLAGQDLSMKKLYKVSRLLDNLEKEIVFFYEQKSKLFAKYCDLVGNQYVPREETKGQFAQEFDELLDTDIEYEVNEVVLGTDEDVKLSYKDLVALKGFVAIEEDD